MFKSRISRNEQIVISVVPYVLHLQHPKYVDKVLFCQAVKVQRHTGLPILIHFRRGTLNSFPSEVVFKLC